MYTEEDIQGAIAAIQHSRDEANQNIEDTKNISDPMLIRWKEGCVFGLELALDMMKSILTAGRETEEGDGFDEYGF